ncbi:m023R [Myxoma virus]|nr:m023R [Myxoma virus]AQT36043.1 m023R [Myxoma virus]AQT36213.1 m023R [Myxoma virus]AQT36383.1 m023R [Myxoma virus]AQT36553.1 m023R [Myxoma virus]
MTDSTTMAPIPSMVAHVANAMATSASIVSLHSKCNGPITFYTYAYDNICRFRFCRNENVCV